MPEKPIVSVRLFERDVEDIVARTYPGWNRSEVVRTDLARYRALVRSARARLAKERVFSGEEQALIIDALNGTMLEEHVEVLAANVEDAMTLDGLDEKWGVQKSALMEKLRSLSPLELAAVADAVEMFWASVARGEERDARGGLF